MAAVIAVSMMCASWAGAQDRPIRLAQASADTASPTFAIEKVLIERARGSGAVEDYEAYLTAFPDGVFSEFAKMEIATLTPTPEETPTEAGPPTFSSIISEGEAPVLGASISKLIEGSPLHAPIEGLPDEVWKGKTCSECHDWTQEALCDQGAFYANKDPERMSSQLHPYGGDFKRAVKAWFDAGCL